MLSPQLLSSLMSFQNVCCPWEPGHRSPPLSLAAFISQRAFALLLSLGFLAPAALLILCFVYTVLPTHFLRFLHELLGKRRASLRPPVAVPSNVINIDARF